MNKYNNFNYIKFLTRVSGPPVKMDESDSAGTSQSDLSGVDNEKDLSFH